MEEFHNSDKSITKYLHDDGSETCIKVVPSKYYKISGEDIVLKQKEHYKYSVLISHSSGCPIGCKMCYLTIKKYSYHPLKYHEITSNVLGAIKAKIKENPFLKEKYIKLCWMGMGDAFLDLQKVNICTTQILDFVFENKLAVGLDGVDIGTVFPKTTKNLFIINNLNQSLINNYSDCMNPYNTNKSRSPLRIFYSLHNSLERQELIPNLPFYRNTCQTLQEFKNLCNIDVIFHQMFLEGVNDHDYNIQALIRLFESIGDNHELRILRYNECKDSLYKESSKFNEIVQRLDKSIPRIKYQVSPGSEIKAACGQFIMKDSI